MDLADLFVSAVVSAFCYGYFCFWLKIQAMPKQNFFCFSPVTNNVIYSQTINRNASLGRTRFLSILLIAIEIYDKKNMCV